MESKFHLEKIFTDIETALMDKISDISQSTKELNAIVNSAMIILNNHIPAITGAIKETVDNGMEAKLRNEFERVITDNFERMCNANHPFRRADIVKETMSAYDYLFLLRARANGTTVEGEIKGESLPVAPALTVAPASESLAESIEILQAHRPGPAELLGDGPHDTDWSSKLVEYSVEVRNTSTEFLFRVVHRPSGRASQWAHYVQVAMLDDVCAATEYFVHQDDALRPISTECFLTHWAVMEPKFEMEDNMF